MFGYVTPCISELKVRDYEKFKAYYCGLCRAIKNNIGNLPRITLNYDMTFLAILLDSLSKDKIVYKRQLCLFHPTRKKTILKSTSALEYAAFYNIAFTYYKLLDDVHDDSSIKSNFLAHWLKIYLNKLPDSFKKNLEYIKKGLNDLTQIETSRNNNSFDKICHPFSNITAFTLCNYTDSNSETLYALGYNLGKWIYVIDALDDLKKDMEKGKFNVLNYCFNKNELNYSEFYVEIQNRVDFILGSCASTCMNYFNKLPISKNQELLHNILQYGLLEKMDKVFKRGAYKNEKSI
ncbi:DUF5685 family protein [Clostridium tyrobutyricum]|uniref:DUF5685 family protein n=1 Tax=Clostridium tyrobutyricum TaxID=1519 RepID=UPI0039F6C1B5